jgi:hypothetical protein
MTTLQSLKPKSNDEREWLLSSVADRLVPKPYDELPASSETKALLEEINKRLGIEGIAKTPEAKARLFQFVANELVSVATDTAHLREARERIGQKGWLRPGLYEVKFAQPFTHSATFGVRRSHVEQALSNPDAIEHLFPEKKGLVEVAPLSLIAKRIDVGKNKDSFFLLVVARRQGFVLTVQMAWRVYPEDVAVRAGTTPLEMLRAFVEKYGLVQRIAGKEAKFFDYMAIPWGESDKHELTIEVLRPDNRPIHQLQMIRPLPQKQMVEIGLCLAIDDDKYRADLAQHT